MKRSTQAYSLCFSLLLLLSSAFGCDGETDSEVVEDSGQDTGDAVSEDVVDDDAEDVIDDSADTPSPDLALDRSDGGPDADGTSEPETTPTECVHDPECTFVFLSAHRGNCADEPENTLAAFRCCIEAGVPMLEVDTRQTADGTVVIMHDGTVTRTTDGEERFGDRTEVDQLTDEEFAQLVIDDERCQEAPNENPERCRPPTWAELLDLSRPSGTVIFIDLKASDPAETIRQALDAGDAARMVLFDGNVEVLRAGIAVYPDLVVMPRVVSISDMENLFDSGVEDLNLTWLHTDSGFAAAAEPTLREMGIRSYFDIFLEVDTPLGLAELIDDPEQAEALREQAWEAFDELVAAGADGLGTNRAAELAEYLHPRGFGVRR